AEDGFAQSRRQLLSELQGAGPAIQVAVVELTSAPRVIAGFGEHRASVAAKVRQLQPSFKRGSYLAAFRQANALLSNSLGRKQRIVLLGDNQENQWKEDLNTPPFLREVEVEVPKAPSAPLPNIGLSEPRLQRIFAGDKALIHFSVKLSHCGKPSTPKVIIRANDKTVLSKTIPLENQPDIILIQAQWPAEPEGWVQGQAMVEGSADALAADDRVCFALPPTAEGKLAVLTESSYLKIGLSPEIMKGKWNARFLDASQMSSSAQSVADSDVLCLDGSFLPVPGCAEMLQTHLAKGRGAVLFLNRLTPAIKENLRTLGFAAEDGPQRKQGSGRFQFVVFNHPVFRPFSSVDYGSLMEVTLHQHVTLKSAQAIPLLFGQNGVPVLFQSTRFPGKLFVAAFVMDRAHTSWPVHPTFIPFLDQILQAARGGDSTPSDYAPGEVAQVRVPAPETHDEIVLWDSQKELARSPLRDHTARLRVPEVPGLYYLRFPGSDRMEQIIAVNPPAKESHLVFASAPPNLPSWQLTSAGKEAVSKPAPERIGTSTILQQRLWWWMVLGCLGALMLEMLLIPGTKEGK
ncbi:MAG TPA: VWA domain-containing protein, partial [Clostridia bacterium]|nr:VWA domain-containing protein [Clostridia bacterium]